MNKERTVGSTVNSPPMQRTISILKNGKRLIAVLLVAVSVVIGAYFMQDMRKGKGLRNYKNYQLIGDWGEFADTVVFGEPTGVAVDTSQNVFILHRAGRKWPLTNRMPRSRIDQNCVLLVDGKSGKPINSWGKDLFIMPHGITIDKENNVWITDAGLHQVLKFNIQGKLITTMGEAGKPGNDSGHFNRPTDVTVGPDGVVYVADGYRNSRVVMFSRSGKYLGCWGKKGKNEKEFDIPHGITCDDAGHVYVADRENNRVQQFDANGTFIRLVTGKSFGKFTAVAFDKNRRELLAADDLVFLGLRHRGSDIFVFDSVFNTRHRFGRSGFADGPAGWYHDVAVDRDGNIFVADMLQNRVHKFAAVAK